MTRLFGTDGIRAVAGNFPLDFHSVYGLGRGLIGLLQEKGFPPRAIIGRDTRESGEWLEQAVYQGIKDAEGEIISAGIIPTSAVAYLTKKHSFSAGIVISASHNPYEDNGIKIFSSAGTKISQEWEERLEAAIASQKRASKEDIPITSDPGLGREYEDFLKSRFSSLRPRKKLKLVLDCSNGASSFLAPRVFSDLGFEVTAINSSPDGKNINDGCGSLFPENLARKVLEAGADIGIAYDGDADRALWVDETGRILNGDHTLFVLSRFMKERERLKSDLIIATTMSNLGLELALKNLGLRLHRTQVGDKYVLEQMVKLNANLGGEQSGHTIFLDECPTGDGILTSLKMLEVMVSKEMSLSELVSEYKEFPQILLNVRVSRKEDFSRFPEIVDTMDQLKDALGRSGRMNVRYSGTEPMARIMIEGKEQTQIERLAKRMAEVITKHLGE